MRPSEILNPVQCKLPNNSFYPILQNYIIDIIRETPSFFKNKLKIIDGVCKYDLSDDEKKFFDKYIIFRPKGLENIPQIKKYFNIEKIHSGKISQYEIDFIDWIEKKPSMIAVLLGNVGWGKTTLLRHFFFYLIQQYGKRIAQKIIPIYIDLKSFINEVESISRSRDIEGFKKLFYFKIIRQSISNVCIPLLKKGNGFHSEEVWSFLKQCDPELDFVEDFIAHCYSDPTEFDKQIFKNRKKFIDENEAYYWVLKFLKEKNGYSPILIIDNADPLSVDVINILVKYIHAKCELLDLQAIISLRPNTFYEIKNKYEHFNEVFANFRIKLNEPEPTQILYNGLKLMRKEINRSINGTIQFGNIRLSTKDILNICEILIKLLLSDAVKEFLRNVSKGDLDNWAHLLKVYAQSGFLDEHNALKRILTEKGYNKSEFQEYFPQWIAFASIITHNYSTYFRNHRIARPKDTIINLFSNRQYRVNNQLIRVHLLSYFYNDQQNISALKDLYFDTFWDNNSSIDYKRCVKAINFALKRLINCGLLSSADIFKISSNDDLEKINKLEITSSGAYYLNTLVKRNEYLRYMKDGCYIDDGFEIINCSESRSRAEIYNNIYSFIKFLYQKECKWYSKMNRKQKDLFKDFFSYNGNFHFTRFLGIAMRDYGQKGYLRNDRDFKTIYIHQFSDLIQKIETAENNILK